MSIAPQKTSNRLNRSRSLPAVFTPRNHIDRPIRSSSVSTSFQYGALDNIPNLDDLKSKAKECIKKYLGGMNEFQTNYTNQALSSDSYSLISFIASDPQRWRDMARFRMDSTIKAFKSDNKTLTDFITSDPKRWCDMEKFRMDSTIKAFVANNKTLTDFITSDPQRWCDMEQFRMDSTIEVFTTNNKTLTDFILSDPKRWLDMDVDKMYHTKEAFKSNNKTLTDFILSDHRRWLDMSIHQMGYTTDAFQENNKDLTNFITSDPKRWCDMAANKMYHTKQAFVANNKTLTNFVTSDPKRWCHMNEDQMECTTNIFNANNKALTDFVTSDPKRWCDMRASRMRNTVYAFGLNNKNVTDFITSDPKRWCDMFSAKMDIFLDVFTARDPFGRRTPILATDDNSPKQQLISLVSGHISAFLLEEPNKMRRIIEHFHKPENDDDDNLRLQDNNQGIHDARIERVSAETLSYLNEKRDKNADIEAVITNFTQDLKIELEKLIQSSSLPDNTKESLNAVLACRENPSDEDIQFGEDIQFLRRKIKPLGTPKDKHSKSAFRLASAFLMIKSNGLSTDFNTNGMNLKEIFAGVLNAGADETMNWTDEVRAVPARQRTQDIKENLVTALSDNFWAYESNDGAISCDPGFANRFAGVLSLCLKQNDEEIVTELPSEYYESSNKNIKKILQLISADIHRERLPHKQRHELPPILQAHIDQATEKVHFILKEEKELDDIAGTAKKIYEAIYTPLLLLNAQDYPKVPLIIHSKTLKQPAITDNLEYDESINDIIEKSKRSKFKKFLSKLIC